MGWIPERGEEEGLAAGALSYHGEPTLSWTSYDGERRRPFTFGPAKAMLRADHVSGPLLSGRRAR
jgi:hypothetical protein